MGECSPPSLRRSSQEQRRASPSFGVSKTATMFMIILAIETSCDDTAIGVVEFTGKRVRVLSNIISSQIEVHKEFGGVHPSLAKREHDKNLPIALEKALRENGPLKNLDAIAVTIGPGLDPCLWSGVEFVKKLAEKSKLPIIPVNHIEAHILVNFQFSIFNFQKRFPAIALVISGGHTQLILVDNIGKYKIIGETRDDAVGECFDKTARILGLGYPGGPAIAAAAAKNIEISKYRNISLPRPMINTKDYDFSFSGLKTAVLYDYKKRDEKTRNSQEYVRAMAKEIQQTAIDILIKKTLSAINNYGAKSLILGGGVSANEELRNQFKRKLKERDYDIDFLVPEKNLSTDNAVMVAIAGYYNRKKATKKYNSIKALPNLRIA
jgi:N6-L-threonylcarbamoyladenine synthase